MIEISLTVSKTQVYNEVAKTTSYAGQKMVDDESAYSRIFTTDADREMLERYWVEACAGATNLLKPWLVSVGAQPESHGVDLGNDYTVTLQVSDRYDESLTDSVETSLYSYVVNTILAKWFVLSNKGETEAYATMAVGMMEDVLQKLYYQKKPERLVPGTGSLLGDLNGDGKVNVSDVTKMINMMLGVEPVDIDKADLNGDGKLNVSDLTKLINIILGRT